MYNGWHNLQPGSGLPELARQLPFPHFPNLSENLTQLA